MASENNLDKENRSNNWLWIILALIIGFFIFFAIKLNIKKANENLNDHLQERHNALDDIFSNIEYYRKRKVEILFAKKQTTWFLRCFVSTILLILNCLYIAKCYPNNITIQHVCEGIATFNAAMLFLVGIFTFAAFGSFFEIKTVYHSFQTITLTFLFKRNEETIEYLQRLNLENREALRKEIIETKNAIQQNEELLKKQAEDWNIDLNFESTDL